MALISSDVELLQAAEAVRKAVNCWSRLGSWMDEAPVQLPDEVNLLFAQFLAESLQQLEDAKYELLRVKNERELE